MAKTFTRIAKVAKSTTYAKISNALVLAASLNSVVQFTPTLAPNGTVDSLATSAEYIIHRAKRIKAKEVSTPNAKTTANDLAALDSFSNIEWTSQGVATGKLRSIGIKTSINEQLNPDTLGEIHAKVISDSTEVSAIERGESLLDMIIKGATHTGEIAAAATGTTPVFDKISEEALRIQLLIDDYKHLVDSTSLVIIIHPSIRDQIVKEIGTEFNSETPIYKTGLTSRFSINGYPVLVDPTLNKFQKGATGSEKRIGAIIMDVESIAFKSASETKPTSVDLGLTRYLGKFYYEVQALVDVERITVLTTASTVPALSAKVSD